MSRCDRSGYSSLFVGMGVLGAGLLVSPGQVMAQESEDSVPGDQNAPAKLERMTLEEVVVTAIRKSLKESLEVKRNADKVVDAVSAEDIGQFPDKNLSEALQRITGVQIDRQDLEGRGVSIRGADPSINRVEINGSEAMSLTAGGGRDVDFRDLPVEFVSRIEVVKSVTPDMAEGGVGGTIRVITRRPFDSDKPYLGASAQAVYNRLSDSDDPKFALLGSRTFFNNTFGLLLGVTDEKRNLDTHEARTTDWVPGKGASASGVTAFLPDIPRDLINQRYTHRTAVNGIAEWRPATGVSLYAEETYAYANEQVDNQALQLSGLTGVVDPAHTVVGPDNTVTHYEIVSTKSNPISLAYRNILGYLTRKQYTSALGGNWDVSRWKLEGKVSYSYGQVDNQEKDAIASVIGLPRAIVDYNNGRDAPNFTFPGIDTTTAQGVNYVQAYYRPMTNKMDEASGRFNIEYLPESSWITSLKTGMEVRTVKMNQVFFAQPITLDATVTPSQLPLIQSIVSQYSSPNKIPFFPTGDLGYTGGVRYWLDNRDGFFNAIPSLSGIPLNINAYPRLLDTWGVKEDTRTGYIQASFAFPSLAIPISGVTGVRLVDTHTLSTGNNQSVNNGVYTVTPGSRSGSYLQALPSLNMRFDFSPSLVGRLAAGRVMGRPSPTQLALRESTNIVTLTGSRGNPDLKPYLARQYDVSLEWYFSKASYVSAGLFRKEISSAIVNVNLPEVIDGVTYAITRPVNTTDRVTMNGIETGGQYVFDSLPWPLNGFGVVANYTYVQDHGYRATNYYTHESLPFFGLSHHSANGSVFYENRRFSVRLSYNWRDRYLITPLGRDNDPEFGEAYGQLDGTATFNVTSHVSLFLDAVNLNKATYYADAGSVNRRIDSATSGYRYFAGVRAVY